MEQPQKIFFQVKKNLKPAALFLIAKIKKMSMLHFIVIALIVVLGIFNGVTALTPQIKQHNREKNIIKTFNVWWNEEGAQEFQRAGLEPTRELKAEEFERYREKYLLQNPSYIIADRIPSMKKDFREWWENQGGIQSFMDENGRYPNEVDYQNSLKAWLDKYTDKFARYRFAFVPSQERYERILTCWTLFPGALSFMTFAGFFFFAIIQMSKRWKTWITAGTVVLTAIAGPVMVTALAGTSFFDHYADERYMGLSLTLAFMLGATAFGNRKDQVSQTTRGICVAGLLLDMIINWFANPGIYGAVTLLSPVFFGLGALAGVKIETKRKTREELNAEALEEKLRQKASANPMAERKARTRALIEKGFASVKNCNHEQAQLLLSQGLTQLLQEHPVDAPFVKSVAQQMASPENYLDYSSNQWMEWGETAKSKNAPDAAIVLLKKCLDREKNANFARRALFVLGEICINHKIELQDGISRLQKVIEINGNDMLAMQAKKMLEVQGASIKPESAKPQVQ